MKINQINIAYFSATFSTKNIIDNIAKGLGGDNFNKIDLAKGCVDDIVFGGNDVLIVGVPVYAGRVPQIAADALQRLKGKLTSAVIVCVYGNRDYDDALLELKDIVTQNGFKVIAAAAFIAQHSIFAKVASGRPNDNDKAVAINFGQDVVKRISNLNENDLANLPDVKVKGNYPYKVTKKIPLSPKASRKCDACGTCARMCPVGAIDKNAPRKTDRKRCIACARCITVCPQRARRFGGLLYNIAGRSFVKKHQQQKDIEIIFATY